MIIYFDTETTGLYPGRIIQLSYIMDSGNGQAGKNFYFDVEYIEPSAAAVHGITAEILHSLSCGRTFSDYADEIYDDFFSASLIVAHNVRFDLNFMMSEFGYLDRIFRYKESFDTMKYFTPIMKLTREGKSAYKYPKLTELTEFADIYAYDVSLAVRKIFGVLPRQTFHSSEFDTAALYLSVQKLSGSFPELKEYLDGFM